MNSQKKLWLAVIAMLATLGGSLTSCAVDSQGPAAQGASYGALGSSNMSDYYYKKEAGWTYAFKNVWNIYDDNGSLSTSYTGANDSIRTLGFTGSFAPNGDSLFQIAITYRILSDYAGRPEVDLRYVPHNGNEYKGAFRDGSTALPNEIGMQKRPRPVSTDTILAGVVGRLRTTCDDFTNSATSQFTWQTDTLWFTSHNDSVYVWERFPGGSQLNCSRLLFCRNFQNNNSWCYDLIFRSTYVKVADPDQSLSTSAGTFSHVMKAEVTTPDVADNMPIKEYKWWACGTGCVKEFDEWYVTTDGVNRNKQDFTRTLISLTH